VLEVVVPPPPVVIAPGPLKVRLIVVPLREPLPVSAKEPVAPAYVPVPPVTVADPLEGALLVGEMIEAGTVIFPVKVPVAPLVNVMVNGATKLVPLMLLKETVEVKVPLPTLFVNDAVPLRLTLAPLKGPLAVTDIAVLTVAAPAAAAARIAKPHIFPIAVI